MENGLIFSHPEKSDAAALYAFSELPEGCELYTCLEADGSERAAELIWCGRDAGGAVRELIFEFFGTRYRFSEGGVKIDRNGLLEETVEAPLCVMRFRGAVPTHSDIVIRLSEKRLCELFRLMSAKTALSDSDERRCIYAMRCSLRSLACFYGIESAEKQLLACAGIVAENSAFALIGDVYTKASHRGCGFASALVRECVRCALLKEKQPLLFCRAEKAAFYERLGFEKI